jgi:hypothetical protein
MAASQRRCPGLLVWGKLIRLCQHPNKASKIFTISSWLLRFCSSSLYYLGRPKCLYPWPDMFVTVSSDSPADSVSLDFHIQMTQIVSEFIF